MINKLSIKVVIYCIIICFSIVAVGCSNDRTKVSYSGYTVVDAMGTTVHIPQKPKRILTLAMCTDSMVLGMLPTTNLVGINNLADDPVSSNIVAKAKKIPLKIKDPSAEEIMALKPDLIIATGWTGADKVSMMRELGFPVIVIPLITTLEDIKQSINIIAAALAEEEKGAEIINKMEQELTFIREKIAKIPESSRKKVVLLSVMTTYGGSGCLFDDMCKYAGVENGIATAGIKNGQVLTKEMLVKINPDILLLSSYNNHGTYDVSKFNNEYLQDPSLQTITAIKTQNLQYPREGYTYNASQDVVYGVRELAYCAYGKEFMQDYDNHISVAPE